jgi:hypothetical protein
MQVLETTLQQLIQGEKQFRAPYFNPVQVGAQEPLAGMDRHLGPVRTFGQPPVKRGRRGYKFARALYGSLVLSPLSGPFAQWALRSSRWSLQQKNGSNGGSTGVCTAALAMCH